MLFDCLLFFVFKCVVCLLLFRFAFFYCCFGLFWGLSVAFVFLLLYVFFVVCCFYLQFSCFLDLQLFCVFAFSFAHFCYWICCLVLIVFRVCFAYMF